MRPTNARAFHIRWWPLLIVAGFISVTALAIREHAQTGAVAIPALVGVCFLAAAWVLFRDWKDMP